MGLRDLLSTSDSIEELEAAGMDRWQESLTLGRRGFLTGASYLAGYVAEIILKCAVLRVWGYGPRETIDRSTLRTLAEMGRRDLGIREEHEGFHSPLFWARFLVESRARFGAALVPGITERLLTNCQRIWSNWNPVLRYKIIEVEPFMLRQLLNDAGWLLEVHSILGE